MPRTAAKTSRASNSGKIVVRVFGTPEIRIGEHRIGLGTEALFAVALYLTTRAGERVSKDELLEMFWPEGPLEDRRHAMRQMMYRLRKVGIDVQDEGNGVFIDSAAVESELEAGALAALPETADLREIERFTAAWPEFSNRLPKPFHVWIEDCRSHLTGQLVKAASRILHRSRRLGAWPDIDRCVRVLLQLDPLNEEATLAAAESAAIGGMKGRAPEILDQYIEEIAPSDAFAAKPAVQLRKRIAERRSKWSEGATREVALVGRSEIVSAISDVIERSAQSDSYSLLILGASGFGKSRIMAEAQEIALLRAARVVALRVEPTLGAHPLATVRDITRRLLEEPGAAAVAPAAMSIARALCREQATENEALGFSTPTAIGEVSRCLVSLLMAICDETRLTVLIDDLHNADDFSLEVIASVLSSINGSRCSAIVAGLSEVTQRLPDSMKAGWGRVLRLTPLGREETEALAHATARTYNRDLSPEALRRIVDASAGHPLFVRELALSASRASLERALPLSLSDVVARHLASRDTHTLSVLRIVALLGDTATVSRVKSAVVFDTDRLRKCIESLAQDGILQTTQTSALRLHDSWRNAVLEGMPSPTRALLALECAEVLQSEPNNQEFSVQRRISELLKLAGEQDAAMKYTFASIDSLLATGLYTLAIEAATNEISHARSPQSSARLRLRQAMGQLGLGNPQQALVLAESVWQTSVLQHEDLLTEHLLALCVSADCKIKTDSADSGPHNELLKLASSTALNGLDRARACLWGARLAANSSSFHLMQSYAHAMSSVETELGSSPTVALARLIITAETGTPAEIMAAIEQLSLVDQRGLSVSDLCVVLRCKCQALRIAHLPDDAIAAGIAAYQLAKQGGLTYAALMAAELVCHTHIDFGRLEAASDWMSATMDSTHGASQGATTTSRQHAKDRLAFAAGNYEVAAASLMHRLDTIRKLRNAQSRASELSLAAAVLAHIGETVVATPLLEEALECAAPFAGRFSGDFLADACLHASRLCGQTERAHEFGARHVRARREAGRYAIPAGFASLLALSSSEG